MTRRQSLLLIVVLAFALVSLAAAQQQDQASATPNPLVQVLQSKGVLTAQEAAAINQAPTPAEQQSRLTQLLYSKGIITQDEYKDTAAAEASRTYQPQGLWLPTAAHASAGEPDAAVAAAPQAPPAPAVIPAVAPVRVLQSEPSKPGGMVPDIKLGSGAKLKLYGFVKSTAAYDTSNPYNIDFELPGLDNVVAPFFPTATLTSTGTFGESGVVGLSGAGVGGSSFGPNGSPSFYLKGSATRMGVNFEWPDIAGGNNTLTGRIETDFEGNFSRAQNRNVSSIRTRMLALRLAWVRVDHQFTDKTTGFFLAGMDWTPFTSSTQANLLETTGGAAYFGSLYERSAQFRFGVWHDFGGPHNIKMGFEPALLMPGFGNNSTDVGDQLGVSERQGSDSARPEINGRIVFQWQLDKAKGVAPAQIIVSGMQGRDEQLVNRAAITNATCGVGVPGSNVLDVTTGSITSGFVYLCPSNVVSALLAAFPRGAHPSNEKWGADAEVQLPTRYFTLIGKYYTGADLKYYFGGQVYSFFNDNAGLRLYQPYVVNPATAGYNTAIEPVTNYCSSGNTGGACPTAYNVDASATTGAIGVPFGFNGTSWQVIPQKPVRSVGAQTQLSFPLSRIFDANPAGRNAGWTIAFTAGVDEAKGRDVRVTQPAGGRNRSDMVAGTLNYKLNQYFNFAYELSLYRSFTTCFAAGTGVPSATNAATAGGFPGPGGGLICSGSPFIQQPMTFGAVTLANGGARAWHDIRNEFGPIITW
jgi:hypothetical protein